MPLPFVNLEIASTAPNFSNVATGDVMMYPGSKTQSIHIGVDRGVNAEIKVSKSNVNVSGAITATSAVAAPVVTIGGSALTYALSNTSNVYFNTNVAISDVTGLQTALDTKMSLTTGGTVNGDMYASCNLYANKKLVVTGLDMTERFKATPADAARVVTTWTGRVSANDTLSWQSVCWSRELGLFAAVAGSNGGGNKVMTSPDAINWTQRNTANDAAGWQSVCWSAELGLFVAVANSGAGSRVMTSVDGATWVPRTADNTMNWVSVAWSPELRLFVAVAGSGGSNRRVMTSPDGVTWTQRTVPNDANGWGAVCWSAELGLFVVVGGGSPVGSCVITSPDGVNWTASVSPTQTWVSVAWSSELRLFAAVAIGGTGNRVMTSPDGATWTSRVSANDNLGWDSVCWAPELSAFVAVAVSGVGNRVMYSLDGVTWLQRPSANDNMSWSAVCWSPEQSMFVSVANGGTGNRVMTSELGPPSYLNVVEANPGLLGFDNRVGQVLANSNDSSNAPAYSWLGDTNTGFYHASNDVIGVVTNGVERMRVGSNGFVGIGTSNPAFTLDVVGDVRASGNVVRMTPVLARFHNTDLTIVNAATTYMQFNSVDTAMSQGSTGVTYAFSTHPQFTNTSGNTICVLVTYSILWSQQATNTRTAWIEYNGASIYGRSGLAPGNDYSGNTGSAIMVLKPNDFFRIVVYQNSGANLNVTASGVATRIQVALL